MRKQLLNKIIIATIFTFVGYNTAIAQTISAGQLHSLAVCADNSAQSWGASTYGTTGQTPTIFGPEMVTGLSGITSVAGGKTHSLFVKNDGTAWACGRNWNGSLGDGTITQRNTAVQVIGLTGITAAAGGGNHYLFLKNDSTVWACGQNAYGELGDGSTTNRLTAVQVLGLTGIIAIAGGEYHSLFLKSDGTVWGCGRNQAGQLGTGSLGGAYSSVFQISGLSGIIGISACDFQSLFVKNDGTAWGCGGNYDGSLGDGTTVAKTIATQVLGLTGITKASTGEYHSVFLKNDGTVWACGKNWIGSLGDGTTTNSLIPIQVLGLSNVIAVEAGGGHNLFLKSDGTLWACGNNNSGQIGDGTILSNKLNVVQVVGLCQSTSVNEIGDQLSISIFPNPSNGRFQLNIDNFTSQKMNLEIFNSIGEIVYSSSITKQQNEIDLSNYSKGIYFIQVKSESEIINKKIIVQ